MRRARPRRAGCAALVLLTLAVVVPSALAAALPSLFRGVVVADSPLGVRIVSVEESSQAAMGDLRAEDIVVRIDEAEVRSIDEFAVVSDALKGRAITSTVLVFRNGVPHELTLHLYSYPVLREWSLSFIPDHDIRFAEAHTGLDYWTRLGRGFERARKPEEALDAYLNGLHNAPTDAATALKVSELLLEVGHRRLNRKEQASGVRSLRDALLVLQHLFDYPLTTEQLTLVRDQLRQTLETLRML